MKTIIPLFIGLLILSGYGFCQQYIVKPRWTLNKPFQQEVFIENNGGQFDSKESKGEKVYFKTRIEGEDIYFTNKGIIYRRDTLVHDNKLQAIENEDKDRLDSKIDHISTEIHWVGADTTAIILPEDKVNFYYTWSPDLNHTIISHAYKKLVYKNLYPGIDAEYSFYHDSSSKKVGLRLNRKNKTSGVLSNSIWYNTYPNSSNYDAGYDLWYDLKGNIYIYGGFDPYQIIMVDSTGVLQWTYSTNFPAYGFGFGFWYGDFVTDKTTGISYVCEAYSEALKSGPEIDKLSPSGILLDTTHIPAGMSEAWRMDINYCTHDIVVAGGGPSYNYCQASVLDTSLNVVTTLNVLGAITGRHDMALMVSDPFGPWCYMATATSSDGDTTFNNVLLKCPVPSLSYPPYIKYDGYNFYERITNTYVYNGFLPPQANGFNGITVSSSEVYIWDGSLITSYNKYSGDIIASNRLDINNYNAPPFAQWLVNYSGIDRDYCENIYIGKHDSIIMLDSNLNVQGTLLSNVQGNNVYDLHVALGNKLYSCGYNFISSFTLRLAKPSITTTSSPACSGCNGTAFVSMSGCMNKRDYLWSNGGVGQYQNNLCAGTYSVSVELSCSDILTDTIVIPSSTNPSVSIPGADVKDVSCFNENNGSAVAIASGGTPPYTYLWYPQNITNDTATHLTPETYTFEVTDIHGCASIDTVTITQPSILGVVASASINAIQIGQNTTLSANASGGTPPYVYSWNNGTTIGSNINVSPITATYYTVSATDANGCTATATVLIDILCGDVFIPNAFSPATQSPASVVGFKGVNTILYVRGDCISQMDFLVFDRWGNKVFESHNINNGWDGNYNGQPMNTGTYVYFLKATMKDGTNEEKKGAVELVR